MYRISQYHSEHNVQNQTYVHRHGLIPNIFALHTRSDGGGVHMVRGVPVDAEQRDVNSDADVDPRGGGRTQ